MARTPFPGSDFGRNTSGEIYRANHTNDVPGWVTGDLADTARQISRGLRNMATQAYEREGQDDAAAAITAGGPLSVRPGQGVDDDAYNAVIREQMLAQRQSAYLDGLSKIEIEADGNMATFATSMIYHDEAFQPTGDARVDSAMAGFVTLQRGAAQRRVREGEEKRRVETARGSYVGAATVGRTSLGQAVSAAGFDDQGAALVSAGLSQYASTIARFGPREAFTIGGVEFAADASRAGVLTPEQMARDFDETQAMTRMTWIARAAEMSPDAASKRAFVGQVRERWQSGDPMFAGLDAGDMDRLTGRLDGDVARSEADETAARNGAAESVRDMLKAAEYGGDVDVAEMRHQAALSGDVSLQAQVEFGSLHGWNITPGNTSLTAGGGAAGTGFSGWADFTLDHLEGSGLVANDNGRGRAQYGITEASHPEAWKDGRIDRTEAAGIFKRDYWDAIGGDSLDPELAFVASAAAVVGGVGTAKDLLEQSGGDVERFLQLEEQRFRRLAAQDPAEYGDDLPGWLARQGKIRGALSAQRAQRRSAEGYATDPVDFARGGKQRPALATVAEFNPGAVFAGGTDGQEWALAIRQRYQMGRGLSERDGVPVRILDNAEARFYKSQIEEDPSRIVPLAAMAATALGGDGARLFFAELDRAGLAGSDLHLGYLALEQRNEPIVRRALEGRRLRVDGAKAPDWGDETSLNEAFQEIGGAFAAQPDLTPAVRALAEDMAIADEARGDRRGAAYYLNGALGATTVNGHRYGGVVEINGASTLAPTWLRADTLDDAFEHAARMFTEQDVGPLYANGQEIPAHVLTSFQLRAMPNGRYQLINPMTNRPVGGRRGSAFEFDIERDSFRDFLVRREPGSVLRSN